MKIVATRMTRCHILKLKCTKFDFGWGSTPDPAGELTVGEWDGWKGEGKGKKGKERAEGELRTEVRGN